MTEQEFMERLRLLRQQNRILEAVAEILNAHEPEEGDGAWNDWPANQTGEEFQFPERKS